ncbi:MAG: HEAT repeat domain-containing protein, partial [Ignavibacteriaceae bacterium]|nr:HEAT repeat domain-containing protein [Ignavibacteriaceae bacterium]
MKKIDFLLLLFFLSFISWAQCDVGELTNLLYSSNVHDRINAAQEIADCNLIELLPVLEERFYAEEYLYAAHKMLFALAKLDSDNLEQIALDFIDNVDNLMTLTPDDPLSSKVYATQILINLRNYSTLDHVFQIVDRDRPDFNPLTIFVLMEFLSNNDLIQYRDYAKTELENYLYTNADYVTRSLVLNRLAASYGTQLIDLILDKVYNEQEWILRSTALKSLLNINYLNSRSVFYERLQDDPHRDIRWEISDSLLCYFGEPQDLKKIIDYYPNESDPIVRKDMQHSTNVFIPPKPDTDYYGLCTRLITYTDEMFVYNWIHNEETKDYYAQRL